MKDWDNLKVSLFSKLSRNGVLKISLYYFTQNIQDTGIAGTQCECSISASVNWFKGRPPSFQKDLSTLFLQLSVMSLWCGLKSSLPFILLNNLIQTPALLMNLWSVRKCKMLLLSHFDTFTWKRQLKIARGNYLSMDSGIVSEWFLMQ